MNYPTHTSFSYAFISLQHLNNYLVKQCFDLAGKYDSEQSSVESIDDEKG